MIMLNILRVNGFYDQGIFFLGGYEEKNIYRLDIDNIENLEAGKGIVIKLLIHNTISNTIETYEIPYLAENFCGLLWKGRFYYARFSHEKTLLHIHSMEFSHTRSSQITVPLADVVGNATVYRTEMRGIDDRYCLFGCSTSKTYKTTHLLLIDFEEKTYCSIAPDFGIDSFCGIETIMTIGDAQLAPNREEIVLITGGCIWTKKYEIWENRRNGRNLEVELTEHVVIFERDSFFRRLKSGLPLEVTDKQMIERCSLHKTIISHGGNEMKINYTMVDFEENRTTSIEYDIHSGKQTRFEYESILRSPVYMDGKLYSIETLDHERYALLDLQTNQFVVILSSDEKILAVDKHIILSYKWLATNQQLVYIYDLGEEPVEQKLLGIGIAHYDGKQVTIFS